MHAAGRFGQDADAAGGRGVPGGEGRLDLDFQYFWYSRIFPAKPICCGEATGRRYGGER